jgi:hypothetical protein
MDAKKKPAGKVKAAAPAAQSAADPGDAGNPGAYVADIPGASAASEIKIPSQGYAAAIPYAVAALAIAHGYDPNYLTAWSCWDGKAVIIGPDGKKFRE